ncbi:MAG: tRNA (adenosine(37)-N6)-threonylcarbamoyltransferase complex ATPase subunit type 1 TsaE [Clostridia bacterium]|nr:tRNA (adenosine(37)-N6)-threonylcarbamoyltransferase complex ATPase subunit type 1 TsaE [Clostridia bacterium]
MIYFTNSTQETEKLGLELAKKLDTGATSRAFVAMRGEMGVGKTAFVRGFAEHFGVRGVKSPTYTIVNEYRGRVPIYHFDTYRIDGEDDLYSIGFDDYTERCGICICEWSEKIEDFLPSDAITVTITRTDDECGRKIEIDATLA